MPSEHQRTEEFRPDDAGAGSPPDGDRGSTPGFRVALDVACDVGHSGRRPTARVGIDWITALDRHR